MTTSFVSGEPTVLADGGTTYYLNSTGKETIYDYVPSGNGTGYLANVYLRRGYTTGSDKKQANYTYTSHTDGNSIIIYPLSSQVQYRNDDGTGGQTTSFSYDAWHGTTNLVKTKSTTFDAVETTQNGPGTSDVSTTVADTYGRIIWSKDGDGYLKYFEYDDATGAMTKRTVDAAEAPSSPPVTRGSGLPTALALSTNYTVDGLGRTTSITSPRGKVTWVVYKDPTHERRIYRGFTATTSTSGTTTGPIEVVREYRPVASGETLYYETLTTAIAPVVASSKPDGSETISSTYIQSLERTLTNTGAQVTGVDDYFSMSGITYSQTTAQMGSSSNDTASGNRHSTTYAYDDRGWLKKTTAPTTTITALVHDTLGRVTSVKIGTDDSGTGSDNMTIISEYQYDGGSTAVGDSNLTKVTQHPGGTDRVTEYYYDWRDRLGAAKVGVEGSEGTSVNRPIYYYTYDNLNELTATNQYDGDAESVTTTSGMVNAPTASKLRARSLSSYDDRGRVYRTAWVKVAQGGGSPGTYSDATALFSDSWFDRRGDLIKVDEPGGIITKTSLDGAGRLTTTYRTDDNAGDTAWTDADDVTGDYVLNQQESVYDADGNIQFAINRDRFHDDTLTGALADESTTPKARVSYIESYFDDANRLTGFADLGTASGTNYSDRPDSVLPARADDKLVTSFTYDDGGRVWKVFDPRNLESRTTNDLLGRVTQAIDGYSDGTPSTSDDRTTEYKYDGNNHVLKATAMLPSSTYQETQYVYNATKGGGGSDVASKDLLTAIYYPDKSTGAANSSTEDEVFAYNALGESKQYSDRAGNVHDYVHDVLDRVTADTVSTLGSGVDGAIRQIRFTFDEAGRPYQFTSYDTTSASPADADIVNQVEREYNDFGQIKTEYQEDAGKVNTSTSGMVQYGYSELSGGNHSRPVSMTYPDGRVLEYQYTSTSGAAGIDARISRLSYMDFSSASSTKLEEYSYVGLGTVVKFAHAQNGVDLTYIKDSGDTVVGDAGDQYKGLDRFNRIIDQRWTISGTDRDRFQYGYDRNGNAMYRDNLLTDSLSGASDLDELYHADDNNSGDPEGYDNLDRLTDFQRGELDAQKDGVTTEARSQGWTLDALGNWSTITTNGTGTSRTHNKQNQITANWSGTYSYSGNGNLTSIVVGASTTSYTYDAWNRLVNNTATASINSYQYTYDALGRRVQEVISGGVNTPVNHLYYSTAWQVILEQTTVEGGIENGPNPGGGEGDLGGGETNGFATSSISNRYAYVWSLNYVDAMVLRDKDATGDGTYEQRLYVQHDANFNTTALTDTSGAVVERCLYDPYGAVTFKTDVWGTRSTSSYDWKYQFEGLRFDKNTGLSDMRMRVYSPSLGRQMQPEPFGGAYLDGMNLYQALGSNPVYFTDPLGLQSAPSTPSTPSQPSQPSQPGGGGGTGSNGPPAPGKPEGPNAAQPGPQDHPRDGGSNNPKPNPPPPAPPTTMPGTGPLSPNLRPDTPRIDRPAGKPVDYPKPGHPRPGGRRPTTKPSTAESSTTEPSTTQPSTTQPSK